MWLEELASESNTIQAQADIMSGRVMASNIKAKLYVNLRWLFDHISGLTNSFGFSSFDIRPSGGPPGLATFRVSFKRRPALSFLKFCIFFCRGCIWFG